MGRILVTLFFAFLCLNAWVQTILALFGQSDDPLLLRTWQLTSGAAAAVAAVGAYRLRRWAPHAVLAYGLITATMIVALGPMLELDESERAGLPMGAAAVAIICAALAFYLHRLVRRTA
jgi:hypothetical protein